MQVVNKRHSPYTVYIGRGSIFDNPFRIGIYGTRQEVIDRFERYLRNNPPLLAELKQLPEDAILGCYCKPLACHGDVIVKLWKELNE